MNLFTLITVNFAALAIFHHAIPRMVRLSQIGVLFFVLVGAWTVAHTILELR